MDQRLFDIHAEVERKHWWFTARRRILLAIVKQLHPPSEPGLLIDVGCGTGSNTAALADEYESIGIDPSPQAISLARTLWPQVKFLCGSAPDDLAGEMPLARVILLADVLEHIETPRQFLARLVDCMSPGAFLVITVPADMSLWSAHDVIHGHYHRYSPSDLEGLWSGLPVRPVMVSHFNSRLYPLVKAVRIVKRALARNSTQPVPDLGRPPFLINGALARLFAGESRILLELLAGRRDAGYSRGVSLLAVLRRTP